MSSFSAASVSVIVPCFRQAHFLSSAIDSALAQTHPAIEVVVVNDGSDDDTEAVAQRYGDRIRYVWKTNGGLPSARNAGIEASSGKYLFFLDADDLLHPDAIAWLIEAANDREDVLCRMGFKYFRQAETVLQEADHIPPASPIFPQMIHANFGPPHSYLCSRRMAAEVGNFFNLRSCEDWDLWLRLGLAGCSLVTVPRAGAYYRSTAGSMSTHSLRMLEARSEVLLRLHNGLLADRRLLEQWGNELLIAECRVRRRGIVQNANVDYLQRLTQAIRQLFSLGFRIPQSMPKRFIDRFLGVYGEYLILKVFKRFEPDTYRYYQKGFF